jgi:predicted transcriptional regulator
MEVHFTPDIQAKLDQMARDSGRRSEELLEEAVIGLYYEMAYTRETLDRRYEDLESGRVRPIPGHEVFARLRANSAARRVKPR